MTKPSTKPANPRFSSGPTSKRPGWSLPALDTASLGRSHRARHPKNRIKAVITESRELLGIPDDYFLGIVPASDTGAFEMAMWNLLGARGVDVLAWESFGLGWVNDIDSQLRLDDVNRLLAAYGELPDLGSANTRERDLVFTWNGTTSGVRVPDADWITKDREGLAFCDATSAVFAMPIDWPKLDVVTWSWQKVLGGEAGQGMLVLSPGAVARLESHTPPWPLPKIFRLTDRGKLNRGIFEGSTINTPSLLAVEDQLDALRWAKEIGGLPALIRRSERNLAAVAAWIEESRWVDFLATEPAHRSSTSICLKVVDPVFSNLDEHRQRSLLNSLTNFLEREGVAQDIGGYRDAPPGLRIWGGATVETDDIEALLPWLDWGWQSIR